MIDRLRITQRLGLLLFLPMSAVVVTSAPFVVSRIDDARTASAVVGTAAQARQVGLLIQELQQERLLALGFLASPRLDRQRLLVAMAAVDAHIRGQAVLTNPSRTPGLGTALDSLQTNLRMRQSVLRRAADPEQVDKAYHQAVLSLVDGLALNGRQGVDVPGTRQMASLDALLRADEEAGQVGAALIIATGDPVLAATLAQTSADRERLHLETFRRHADADHVALFDAVGKGPTARRITELVNHVINGGAAADRLPIDDAVAAAQAGVSIRRALQERIARDLSTRAAGNAASARLATGVGSALVLGLLVAVLWLGVAVGRSVAVPLRRLTLAASMVADLASQELVRVADVEADDDSPPRLVAVNLRTQDEIGELASAFNRVQATAALMMEQQVTTRRNVAVMFSNIAHRTRGLVARQLAQIDALEHDEHDEQRLTQLYQLDHVTMRLRRSAASLLVIAGTRHQQVVESAAPLADVIRSAVAEIEGYRHVQIGMVEPVTVAAALVSDLMLLLAELLENATSFSPPDTPVEISAQVASGCLIRIVDHGIGMPTPRLAQENSRLRERERLDVAPTAMLGLFVVGRIARRHGLRVQLHPSPGTGITAEVTVPQSFLLAAAEARALPGVHQAASEPVTPIAAPTPREPSGPVHHPTMPEQDPIGLPWPQPAQQARWSMPQPDLTIATRADRAGAPVAPAPASKPLDDTGQRSGLRRRERGASAPINGETSPASRRPERDPEQERSGLDAFMRGFVEGHDALADDTSRTPEPPPRALPPEPTRAAPAPAPSLPAPPPVAAPVTHEAPPHAHGLSRRRPGEHLPAELRSEAWSAAGRPAQPMRSQPPSGHPAMGRRDAEAERSALADYTAGLARAADRNSYDDRSGT